MGQKKGGTTQDREILKLQDDYKDSVAHLLARKSNTTNWSTEDKEILKLKDYAERSVAYLLAYYHPTWTTDNLEILSLVNKYGETVEDMLEEKGKINKRRL